jgi:hypothetical protein
VVVVVDELGDGVIVATGHDAGGGFVGMHCGFGGVSRERGRDGENRGGREGSRLFSWTGFSVVLGG